MARRDKTLIRELMFKLEEIAKPGVIYSISMDDEQVRVPGYTVDEIYDHLQQINRMGLILDGDSGPMIGVGFGGFTERGHDYLDEEHARLDAKPVPQSELDEVREEIAELRRRLNALASNAGKAEIEADLDHLTIEAERPEPKRSSIRSFFVELRNSLLKVTTQEGVHEAIAHLEAFARLKGWL